jgi:hypothetical protein
MNSKADVTYSSSDSEIIDKVVNPEKSLPFEMDPDEEEAEDNTSWADASTGLETLITSAESHSGFHLKK